ncbi:hypothetical protein [Magnetospirillum sp. 15-1]|uniref:hypothetical protein n=1 Tax=Magnetospirillum sp. 15-1 TaxID=1979370 RepID=UPI000BBC92F0|nr:hypothetical protein [Magnetospirillum sp. 15-1]
MSKYLLLDHKFLNTFNSDPLVPLLGVVYWNRDLIIEIRDDAVDICCKGQVAVHMEPGSGGTYVLSADKAFWDRASRVVASNTTLPSRRRSRLSRTFVPLPSSFRHRMEKGGHIPRMRDVGRRAIVHKTRSRRVLAGVSVWQGRE